MTDRRMLELCLEAFEAIPAAYSSKAFMNRNKEDVPIEPYAGPATYRLAKNMQRSLRHHLGIQDQQ